jgi:DNA-binding NarL/FixJ family response regulator
MTTEIKLLIADDHPIFRRGLRVVIEADPCLKVIAEADNGARALDLIREAPPDIALLDLDMPIKDGFEVTRDIQEMRLEVEVIFLTMHKTEKLFNAALDLGVKGYVLKDSALTEIIDCVKAVSRGQSYASPQLTTFMISRNQRAAALVKQKPSLNDLTPTERRILKLVAEEKTSRAIAAELFISPRTVEHHRANICLKLDLHGSNALMKFALAHKSELL